MVYTFLCGVDTILIKKVKIMKEEAFVVNGEMFFSGKEYLHALKLEREHDLERKLVLLKKKLKRNQELRHSNFN